MRGRRIDYGRLPGQDGGNLRWTVGELATSADRRLKRGDFILGWIGDGHRGADLRAAP